MPLKLKAKTDSPMTPCIPFYSITVGSISFHGFFLNPYIRRSKMHIYILTQKRKRKKIKVQEKTASGNSKMVRMRRAPDPQQQLGSRVLGLSSLRLLTCSLPRFPLLKREPTPFWNVVRMKARGLPGAQIHSREYVPGGLALHPFRS